VTAIDHALRAIVGAELMPVLDELRAVRSELEALRAQSKPAEFVPLTAIIAGANGEPISPRAALGRLDRDPELRALGHRVGRRLLFRAAEVQQLFAERQKGVAR
jgi:hypothetical protein